MNAPPAAARPAYPDPVALPVPPDGEPVWATRLAAECRDLAADAELAGRRAAVVFARLARQWRGTGSRALEVAADAVAADTAVACRGLRELADRLDDYAAAARRAHEHHRWSIGRLLAVGAVVAVGAAAVVVTVGAAAPVGSVAAAEVGAAIGAAEAAATAAGAAQAELAAALLQARAVLAGVRGLRLARAALAGPAGQGALAAGVDGLGRLATGRRVDTGELAGSFLLGAVSAAATGAAVTGMRSAGARAGLPGAVRPATDVLAAGLAAGGVETGRELAGDHHVEPGRVGSAGLWTLLGAGLAPGWGGAGATGWRLGAAAASGGRRGQPVAELLAGRVRLDLHEGGAHGGHTLRRHVAKPAGWLAARAVREHRPVVSTFFDVGAAEAAIAHLLRANAEDLRAYLGRAPRPGEAPLFLRGEVPEPPGYVLHADGRRERSRVVCLKAIRSEGRLLIVTAYLDPPAPRPGRECFADAGRPRARAARR